MRAILTPDAPAPAGHYSQAVHAAGLVFVSGQLPIDPATGLKINGSIEDEARRTLQNMLNVVRAAGGTVEDIVKVSIYIVNIADWSRVNAVYREVFGTHRPARAVVGCSRLHFDSQIEIEAIASLPANK